MENTKWLKRKYPDSFELLNTYFDRHQLDDFKKSNRKLAILNEDIIQCQKYKKGQVIEFSKSNPINDFNHPFMYCVIKCQLGYPQSGYHSFNLPINTNITEITS